MILFLGSFFFRLTFPLAKALVFRETAEYPEWNFEYRSVIVQTRVFRQFGTPFQVVCLDNFKGIAVTITLNKKSIAITHPKP